MKIFSINNTCWLRALFCSVLRTGDQKIAQGGTRNEMDGWMVGFMLSLEKP